MKIDTAISFFFVFFFLKKKLSQTPEEICGKTKYTGLKSL